MNLYILRHAIAVDKSPTRNDSDRELTKKGIEQLEMVGKKLKKRNFSFDWIIASPYKRTYQTASVIVKEFKIKNKIKLNKFLVPGSDPRDIIRELSAAHYAHSNILLVGHEPFLSELISILLTGDSNLHSDFKKSGFCELSIDHLKFGKCAVLARFLSPKDFDAD